MRYGFIVAGAICALAVCRPAGAEMLWATNGLNLLSFDSATPGIVTSVSLTGLQTGEMLVGLDLRPNGNVLYGVGSTSRLYAISTLGAATQVGTSGQFTLSGASFGLDFDPVAEPTGSLRLISDTQQNLRLDPSNGSATIDTALTQTDLTAIAYDNNFVGATSSNLFAIDATNGTLNLISSPNAGGPVVLIGSMGLGTSLNPSIGYEISGLTGTHYASIYVNSQYRLYQVNATTGTATFIGQIGTGTYPLLGLAAAVPEPMGLTLMLAGMCGALMRRRA